MKNTQIVLRSRPVAEPTSDNFELVVAEVPEPGALADGEVLVRNRFLSLDPYMRGRMSDAESYAAPQPLGEVMIGGTAGVVIGSKNPAFAVGDEVVGMGGWQEITLVGEKQRGVIRKVDTSRIPLSAYLGVVGMPGVTAWYGVNRLLVPKPGETVVVSAASGAVGSIAGQLARARGARAIGLAGGPAKCAYVQEELGFDACIDYRAHETLASLESALERACPKGIDAYFENVGGMILDAVMLRANPFCRVAFCGAIAGYNGEPIPMRDPMLILTKRMRLEGFVISEHMDVWPEALTSLAKLVATGELKYKETIARGLTAAPEAFLGLLKGKSLGKQLVALD